MKNLGLRLRMAFTGAVLFAFYALWVLWLGQAFSLPLLVGATLAFVAVQYKVSLWLTLRSVGAEDPPETPEWNRVRQRVSELAEEMGVPEPTVRRARMGAPNAFAIGRQGNGYVVVADELLDVLPDEETDAVLAHEVAHLANRDTTLMLLGQSIATILGVTVMFLGALVSESIIGDIVALVLGMVTHLVVTVFVLALSRYREYAADAVATEHVSGAAMGRALTRIHGATHDRELPVGDTAQTLCLHPGRRGILATILSTHPATVKRVRRVAPDLLVDGELPDDLLDAGRPTDQELADLVEEMAARER